MKLSKNILILFGSYLGAVALVTCIGRFTHTVGGSTPAIRDDSGAGSDLSVGAPDPDGSLDVPTAGTTNDAHTGREDPPQSDAVTDTTPPATDGTDAGTNGEGNDLEAPTEEVYFLRTVPAEENGSSSVIGVYDSEGRLVDLLDTPVFALPAHDRELLADGIRVEGEEALRALLEDLCA